MRQTLPAELRVAVQSGPAAFGELPEGFLEARRGGDDAVSKPGASAVTGLVERIEHTGRELAGFLQNCVNKVRSDFLASG